MSWSVVKGDMRQLLPILARESVDSIVCDPPYGLSKEPNVVEVLEHWIRGDDYVHKGGGFMGKGWDSFVPGPSYWKACYDALKPGGHLIAFGGTRTYDLLVIAIRMAGFEIRDQLAWMYGSGFPKSLSVSKAIDRQLGHQRPVAGQGEIIDRNALDYGGSSGKAKNGLKSEWVDHPAETEEAEQWEGWGTALKPAFEPIVLARKPLGEKTVAANVLANGTGALNIDATRIGTTKDVPASISNHVARDEGVYEGNRDGSWGNEQGGLGSGHDPNTGRWPANVVLSHTEDCKLIGKTVRKGDNRETGAVRRPSGVGDVGAENGDSEPNAKVYGDAEVEIWSCADDCPVFLLDQQGPISGTPRPYDPQDRPSEDDGGMFGLGVRRGGGQIGDVGPSRFFYTAKVSKKERNAGLPEGMTNKHPTLKPIELMRWLVRLVTPFGGIVFDPFCGSGSTGCAAAMEGFSFVGIDLDEEDTNVEVAQHRIAHWERQSARAATIV